MRNRLFYFLLGVLIQFFSFNVFSQSGCIEGEILDYETGMPISDVQIYCSLSNRGAVTNDVGEFKICGVVENALLEINHLAYYPQVIYVSDSAKTFISVSLKVREVITDEVVIKGLSGNL